MAHVFVSGGTGYLGQAVIRQLLERGHNVLSLVRPGSQGKLPPGTRTVAGDALEAASFAGSIAPADTFIHLVGAPKPAPWKGAQFRAIDQVSLNASVAAAVAAGIRHFIYVSVAHP